MPHPPKSTKIRIITHDIRKLTSPLVTTEMGSISLGKYTFFIRFEFIVMQVVPCVMVVVNQVHGIIPQIKKIR